MIVGTIFAAALASWVARRMLVGPIPADVDEQVEPWTHWLTMVLSGTVLGTAVIGLPLLAAMIIALVIDWHVTEMVPAFVAVLFLTATCRATIWIVINIGLISVVRRRRTDI
jgi:hypothetical protein